MTGTQIRQAYLKYFTDSPRNHAEIPAARLVPDNDPTTLFTSSGMQQLAPYLKGESHAMGTRLVDSQPSFRAEDIDEVGDNRHTTFFEMLGNWSLGDYFKKEQLSWFLSFLYNEIKLDPTRLYVTIFEGDKFTPRDTESELIWREQFNQVSKEFSEIGINEVTVNKNPELGIKPADRIFYYGAKKNWWSRAGIPSNMPIGEIGGPDSEVFYDFDPNNNLRIHEQSTFNKNQCHPNCDCGRFMEIGNSVFMEFVKAEDGFFKPLPKRNVDFGGGLERITAAAQNQLDIFKTDLFQPIIAQLEIHSGKKYEEHATQMRIIADHLRASAFMIAQGLIPSNKTQGYFLRRLLRRAALKAKQINLQPNIGPVFKEITWLIIDKIYGQTYFQNLNAEEIGNVIEEEVSRFEKALNRGLGQIEKIEIVTGKEAFNLFQSYGFPLELTIELAEEKGQVIDKKEFESEFKKHQDISRAGSQGLFKGGLADHSDIIVKYHTTTHLLQAALRQILGDHVKQMGSNITAERLRFDFKHGEKLTPEQISRIEALINQKIQENLPVTKIIMSKDEALKSGAIAFFRDKYPDTVSVYTIGQDPQTNWFSKELCGGPHVSSTGIIGPVTIKKEEAVGAGVRRVYLTLQSA